MNHLYAPWRAEYFAQNIEDCVFCHIGKNFEKDEELGVLFRDTKCFGVMNRYPYTPGHFMIIPYEHVDSIEKLSSETWGQMSSHVQTTVLMVKEILEVKGVNIGMNLGECAGAGIAEHIHYHIVPRWERDTNFITTIGNVRVNGVSFDKIFLKLKAASKKYIKINKN